MGGPQPLCWRHLRDGNALRHPSGVVHAVLQAWVHLGPLHDAPAAAQSSRCAPGALKGKML